MHPIRWEALAFGFVLFSLRLNLLSHLGSSLGVAEPADPRCLGPAGIVEGSLSTRWKGKLGSKHQPDFLGAPVPHQPLQQRRGSELEPWSAVNSSELQPLDPLNSPQARQSPTNQLQTPETSNSGQGWCSSACTPTAACATIRMPRTRSSLCVECLTCATSPDRKSFRKQTKKN